MKKLLFLAFALSIFSIENVAGQTDFQKKISPGLLERMSHGPSEMLVLMAAQADVSDAERIADWNERGQFVYQNLKNLADASQQNVLAVCETFDAPRQSFHIVNMVLTSGNLALAEALAALPEVSQLIENESFMGAKPLEKTEDIRPEEVADRTTTTVEWGLTKIKADLVWNQGFRGAGIVVGGADTGYKWDNPALKRSYRGWDGTTVDHDYSWHDAIHALINGGSNSCGLNSPVPCDDHDHGTHTMGTMVGLDSLESDANLIQHLGVAPDAKWIGCRNMEAGDGVATTYTECFEWFLAPTKVNGSSPDPTKRPHVINNSWGCPPSEGCVISNAATHWIIRTSLINLRNAGTVVVASAGNSGPACATVKDPPAIYAAAFSVAASTIQDTIATFSSRGWVTVDTSNRPKPQVSAPGRDVRSCTRTGFGTWSGTSMAGPHVAGEVALILDANPGLIGNVVAVENIMKSSAVQIVASPWQTCFGKNGSQFPNYITGAGRINAEAAVNLALPIELLSFFGKQEKEVIRLDWKTGSEILNSHFEIEKSSDGHTWKQLGKVAGSGTTNEAKNWQFVDPQPFMGLNYYRLKQVDFDGQADFSPVVAVEFFQNSTIRAWPNPVGDELTLAFSSEKNEAVELSIIDSNGRQLSKTAMPIVRGSLTWRLPVGDLPGGFYFLKMTDENGRQIGSGRFLKDGN